MQARAGSLASSRAIRFGLALPLVLVLAALALAAGVRPAAAHAVVTSSKPADGEQLKTPPSEVVVNFSETVSSELGGLKVLDAAGNRVDQNDSSQPTPTTLRTSLNPGLPDGTFIANYKVVSADGHAISGAIVFAVGNAKIGDVSSLEAKNDPAMEALSRVGQFLTYLGALLAAGLAFFLAFLHDRAADRGRLQSITRVATIVAALGIAVTILAQGALATSGGLGAAFQSGTIGPVLRQGLGWFAAVLLVGLAAVHLSVDMRKTVAAQALAFYGGLAVTGSFVLWGHATETDNPWLVIPADVIHVSGAAAWFGGLVGLLLVLRARRPALRTTAASLALADAGSTAASGPPNRTDLVAEAEVGGGDASGEGAPDGGGVALLTRPEGAPTSAPGSGRAREGGEEAGAGGGDGSGLRGTGAPEGGSDPARRVPGPVPGSFASTVGVVRRFSTLAAVSVILLTLAGTALAYTELGSFSALLSTSYGVTLSIKLALVAVVLFMAGYNRFSLLPWLLPDPDVVPAAMSQPSPEVAPPAEGSTAADRTEPAIPPPTDPVTEEEAAGWRTLVRTLVFEAVGIVAILAVTAVLVNVTPGVSTGTSEEKAPFQQSQPFRDGKVSITIAPNTAGPNNIHLDFTGPDGRPADLAQKVTLELALPAKDIGPLTREFVKAGTGHFILENINDLSIPGAWKVTLLVRVSDFDQERVEFQDTVT